MQSNQVETYEEREFLDDCIDSNVLSKIKREISGDNDFQRVQKVRAYIESNHCTEAELKTLLDEIKNVYICDNSFDAAEQGIYLFLKRLIKI